ncbi:MAG: rhamnulokinase family protein [Clostridia bacterium]
MKKLQLLAFDLGASNGRAVLGEFNGERITLSELHRFENHMVNQNGLYYWDALELLRQMKTGFAAHKQRNAGKLDCFGIDTWGVDYGLLDHNGSLLGNPRCYRNSTKDDADAAHAIVPQRTLFDRTGISSMSFNTVYQLYHRVKERDGALSAAKTLLFMPDLFGYFLTGEKATEYSIATTSMLYDGMHRTWDSASMQALEIPQSIFTPIDFAGTLRGKLLSSVADDLGVNRIPFAAVGTHDTASAVAAIPGSGSFAFCSSGTWSLFGVETDKPVLTNKVFDANFSNEGTVQGGFRPLKNIMGLWLIQECRRDWIKSGRDLSWDEIVLAAESAEPFRSLINPDEAQFFAAGNMEMKIQIYCKQTGQPIPETVGQVARTIYESLALKYRHALETLEQIKGGEPIGQLNIVGGGIQNKLLNQFAANATGRTVVTGPVEGACAGNLLYQAVALGELSGIEEVRSIICRSFDTETYAPADAQKWHDAYGRLLKYMEAEHQ